TATVAPNGTASPGETKLSACRKPSALARAISPSDRRRSGTPTTWTLPLAYARSSAETSSRPDAIWIACFLISSAEVASALPPTTRLRLPPVPPPVGVSCVSPCRRRTDSNGTPSVSATTWAKLVSCPWPCDDEPVRAVIPPLESTSMLRSEEHTSELQSRGHLVCRLLLE